MSLLGEALQHRSEFDAIAYTGRSGGLLAAVHQLWELTKPIPAAVVPSKWHVAGHVGKNYWQVPNRELIRQGQPIVDVIRSRLSENDEKAYQQWVYRKPAAKLPTARTRFLLVDDTVTVIDGSTYQFIQRMVWGCGGTLVGFVAGTEGLNNGFTGYHTHAEWARWSYFYSINPANEARRVPQLRAMHSSRQLDEPLTTAAEMYLEELCDA